MAKFRKLSIVVEAEQFWPSRPPWPEGVIQILFSGGNRFVIETLEGEMQINGGEWIITGIKGERYPCKPDIFEETYEALDGQ